MIGAVSVADDDEIMLISDKGTLVRTPVAGVSVIGRNTQGVRLIALGDGESLVGVEPIADLVGISADAVDLDDGEVADSGDIEDGSQSDSADGAVTE